MGERARKSAESAWRSPPAGFPQRVPDLYYSLRADFRAAPARLWSELGVLIQRVNQLFGDHSAELITRRVTAEGWRIGLPWRQASYCCRLPVRLADLQSDELRAYVDDSIANGWEIQALRGGGKYRHPVWRLGLDSSIDENMLSLALATRHIREEQRLELFRVTTEFFEAAMRGAEVASGYGELIRSTEADVYHWDTPGDPFERWLALTLERDERAGGGHALAGPRMIMLLTGAQLTRLGGREALIQRAAAAGLTTGPAEPPPPGRFRSYLDVAFQELREGLLLVLESPDLTKWNRTRGWSSGLMEPGPAAWWMLDELLAAGLLAYASPGRLARHNERAERKYRGAQEQVQQRARLKREGRPRPMGPQARRTYLLAHPPRCITGSALATRDLPRGTRVTDNTLWFRLRSDKLSDAMPVYGRGGSDPATLSDPVLVGAIKPERAALFFDRRVHGWDGEFAEEVPEWSRPLGRLRQLVCPKCGARLFQVWAGFEYDDTDEGLDTAELQARRQDFYTWFWLVAQCAGCHWAETVADVECA